MKRFMYLSIGVLCLSLSALIGFHVGSRTAQAQSVGGGFVDVVKGAGAYYNALRSDGAYFWYDSLNDTYYEYANNAPGDGYVGMNWVGESEVYAIKSNGEIYKFTQNDWEYMTTLPTGSAVPTSQNTWGGIKSQTGTDSN